HLLRERLGLRRVHLELVDHADAVFARELRQDRRHAGAVHLAVHLVGEVLVRRVREDLAAAALQRVRGHAGARAAGAFLPPRLLGRVVHSAAILLGARADARVRLERDYNLVYERFVVIAPEHGVIRVQRAAAAAAILAYEFEFHDQALGAGCLAAGLAAGFASAFGAALGSAFGAALGACAFTAARWHLAASWTTTTRPLEPGTEPFTSSSWRSASMRTISSLEMVRRALPRCPGMRLPLKTCAGLWFWPVEPGTRWEIELPCEAFCPPK